LTIAAALMGGVGVSFGIAAAKLASDRRWSILGGALGGLIVGASAKLLGLDAFNLLLGRSPGEITGGIEGALLGGGVGLGAWAAGKQKRSIRRSAAIAALAGGAAGLLSILLGGRLMGGSLDLLARSFPDSRLRMDAVGTLFGEPGFGPVSEAVTGTLEGALFAACVVGAIRLAERNLAKSG